jgi:ketosteroid isomerase-like protein
MKSTACKGINQTMKAAFILSALIFVPFAAMEPEGSSALFQMREAELNFAKASVMYGRNSAFVENLAEDCVVFAGKWVVNGRQFFREQEAGPIVLKWEPDFMDISESRDFGVSTGPWEVQEYRPNTDTTLKGYFLTVWKKQADGKWKAILDDGATMTASETREHPFSFPAGADKPVRSPRKVDVQLTCRELLETEKEFLAAWKKSSVSATYSAYIAPKARLLRSGDVPIVSPEGIKYLLSDQDKTLSWSALGSGAASSGDMGFTYGTFEVQSESGAGIYHYVRIWKKQPDGKWKIIVEMMNSD